MIRIVPAQAQHLEAMALIEKASYPSELVTSLAGFNKILAAPHLGELWAAIDAENRVCGLSYFKMNGGLCTIFDVAVDPMNQRQGVGTLLVEAIVAKARATSMKRLQLYVAETNDAAIRLYEKFHFKKSAPLLEYYPNDEDGWVMDLKI